MAGARVGCDYAGTVEEVGSKVSKEFKKGDRVAGVCHGSNAVGHEDGCFGNYITAKGDLQIKIPSRLSFEEASTLGIGVTTAGQALYQSLQLPMPFQKPESKEKVLIYGGSTATGALAIQFAKLSGLIVLTTCSSKNFDYVKRLGADAVFDYNSPNCLEQIKRYSNDELDQVLDCVSVEDSAKIAVASLKPSGGIYATLQPIPDALVQSINKNAINKLTVAYTAIGEAFANGPAKFDPKPEDFRFSRFFFEYARFLLEVGDLKAHFHSVNEGGKGLEGALKGLQAMREGKISGRKLVYTL